MKKLRLDPDALRVQSFDTEDEEEARGTVMAFNTETYTDPNYYPSCQPTCGIIGTKRHGRAMFISNPPRNCCI